MAWFFLAISAAFFESTKDVVSKKILKQVYQVDEYILTWSLAAFTALFLVPLLIWTKIPTITPDFWGALAIAGSLNTIAAGLYLKAIKSSDLSITAPITSFTPLYLLLTSPIIVHEFLTLIDLVGCLLIILGAYILNRTARSQSIWTPFQIILKEPGSRMMLIVAFIWSITSNFDKIGIQNSSTIFWLIALHLFIAIAQLPVMLYKSHKPVKTISKNLSSLLLISLINGLIVLFQMAALALTLVVHVISVKRMSILISVIFGALFFQERGLKQRLAGSTVMVLGVLLIAWS